MLQSSKNFFRSALVAAFAMTGLTIGTSQAHADWDDVQELAYEVEDRSDYVYDLAAAEARPGDPDEEYSLELLAQLSVQAENFRFAVNRYPWMSYSYSNSEYAQLYTAFYRAQTSLQYARFSYRVDQEFSDLARAMERLRMEYNYSFRPDRSWVYLTYRDYWYHRLGHRHDRVRWRNYYRERINRRRAARDRWERDYGHRRPPHRRPPRWDRDRDRRPGPVRPPRRDDRRPGPVQPPRRDDRRPGPVQPPRRDDRRPGPVQPPRRDDRRPGPVQPPRRDDRRPGPVQPPRRDDRRPGPVQPPRRGGEDRARPGRPDRGGNDGVRPGRPGRGGNEGRGGDRGRRPPRGGG